MLHSSLTEWDIESEFSNFYDPLAIPPWNKLTAKLCEELENEIFVQLIFLSREQLGNEYEAISRQENPGMAFFTTVERKYGEHVTEFLLNLFSETNLHTHAGMVKVADKIKEYCDIDRKYRSNRRPPGHSSNLFGREQLMKDCLDCLTRDDKVGVVLCGLSGMGKTSLAAEVCYSLQTSRPPWEIVTINQRGKTELRELCADLVSGLPRVPGPDGKPHDDDHGGGYHGELDLDCLIKQVRDLMKQLCSSRMGKKLVIWLDDMDGHCYSGQPDELCNFLGVIADIVKQKTQTQTRLLITVARKLGKEHEPVWKMNQRLGGQLKEFEVSGLSPADTKAIISSVAIGLKDKDLTDGVCDKLCELCCGSPIAIRAVADLLRDGCKVPELIGYLKYDGASPFMNEQLSKCIAKSLEKLDIDIGSKECRELLVQLSVFQSAEFDVEDVLAVTQDTQGNEMLKYFKDVNKRKIMVRLIEFKARHLLEINSQYKKRNTESHSYSLHPLVVRYLESIIKDSKEFRVVEEQAKGRFLTFFYQKIQDFAVKQHKNPVKMKYKIEDKWVHIKHFFELLLYDDFCKTISVIDLTPKSHKMSRKSVTMQYSHMWRLAASFLHIERMKKFAQGQAEQAKERRNVCGYIFWTCVEAENLIQREKIELAEKTLTAMTSDIGENAGEDVREIKLGTKIADCEWPPVEVVPVYATYCYTQGKLLSVTKHYKRALDYLSLAESLYEGHVPNVLRSLIGKEKIRTREFKSDLAKVQNLIGVVYFEKEDYETSRRYHAKAFDIIKTDLGEGVKWHEDCTEYLSNLATTYHQEGLNTADKSVKKQMFDTAMQQYTQCIEADNTMKRESSFSHGIVLKKRAEIYYLQDDFQRAITDQKKALKIMTSKFRPPSIHITLCFEQMARYLFKLGKEQERQHKKIEADTSFDDALEHFDYALSHIVIGGLPIEHNNNRTYRICRDKHLELLKKMGMKIRKVEQKYKNFEMGHYDKSIQQNREDDFDMEEFLKTAREEGTEFELIPCTDEEDSDDSSEESSSSVHSSSSSNGQQSMTMAHIQDHRSTCGQDGMAVTHRQDSGVDMVAARTASMEVVDRDSGMFKPLTEPFIAWRADDGIIQGAGIKQGTRSLGGNMSYRDTRVISQELAPVEYRVKDDVSRDSQRPSVRDSGLGESAEYDEKPYIHSDPRRQLVRQSSIDEHEQFVFRRPRDYSESSSMECASFPKTPQNFTPQRPVTLSVIQHTSQHASRKRSLEGHQDDEQPGSSRSTAEERRHIFSSPSGSGSGGSSDDLGRSWRSGGSQDSVITQFRQFTPFEHSISQEDAEEEPAVKKLRPSMEYRDEEDEV